MTAPPASPWRSPRRWIALAFIALVLYLAMDTVLNPFEGMAYQEIPHGNHVHYVPHDRDPNVDLHNFPTTAPGPNERILPDGRVVPK